MPKAGRGGLLLRDDLEDVGEAACVSMYINVCGGVTFTVLNIGLLCIAMDRFRCFYQLSNRRVLFAFIDNYIILGKTTKAVMDFINNNRLNNTLKDDVNYINFSSQLAGKSNELKKYNLFNIQTTKISVLLNP